MTSSRSLLLKLFEDSVFLEELKPFGIKVQAKSKEQPLNLNHKLILDLMGQTPLVLFRGFQSLSQDSFLKTCADDIKTQLLQWDFGPVMNLKVRLDAENYLFSKESVPFHWDGAFHTVPSYLAFNCLEAPNPQAGGETLFCNTENILASATQAERTSWKNTQLTYETEKKAHYGGKFQVNMIEEHPKNKKQILRYAEPVDTKLNPVSLTVHGAAGDSKEQFISNMKRKLYDNCHCYQHVWQNGDFLIADNHTLLHGRNAFHEASPRYLQRLQIL